MMGMLTPKHIKAARLFFQDDGESYWGVRALTGAGKSPDLAMNKRTSAKSDEAADNLAVLWNLGVDYVQGSYFQQIDTEDNNDSGSEATVSSDSAVPRWAHTPGET